MATIPDSVKAQLDADWTGAGGAEPTYYVEEDFRTNPPLGQDAVWILSSTLDTDPVPFNDTFVNEKHVLEMVVNTLTSEDRLKELGDEVVRILNATAIADITYQRLKRRKITSGVDKGTFNYQEVITYDLQQQMKSSAAAYGSGATGPFDVVGDFSVSGDSVLTGDLSVSGYDFEESLMLGSANAQWISCAVEGWNPHDKATVSNIGQVENIDTTTIYVAHMCPLPTNRGSQKLYISGTRISLADADANDYVTNTFVEGLTTTSKATLDQDATNKNTVALWTDTFTPVDCSTYKAIRVRLQCECNDAADLNINYTQVQAYYA